MKLLGSKRKVSFLRRKFDSFLLRYLYSKSKENNKIRGQRLAVYANDWIGLNINIYGVYEKDYLDILFEFFRPLDGVFKFGLALDIGANIGNHSIYFNRFFSRVCAFEPNPSTFYLLKFNSYYSDAVEVYNFGLSDEKGVLDLYEDFDNFGRSSFKILANKPDNIIKSSVNRLDDIDIDFNGLCFIKIDVEGFEANVIRGGLKTIKEYTPIVVFEQHISEFDKKNNDTETISLLRELGYSFCWLDIGEKNSSWVFRRLVNFYEMVFGENVFLYISSGDKVPARNHNMIIAVPDIYRHKLGL